MKRSKDIIIYNSIRDHRVKMNLSQSALASLIGVSKNTVSSWELGLYDPSVQHIFLLCKIFSCEFCDLFDFVDLTGECGFG